MSLFQSFQGFPIYDIFNMLRADAELFTALSPSYSLRHIDILHR